MFKYMYFSAIFCQFLLLFSVYTDQGNLYVHLTNRFHVAMCHFSDRSQMTSKCGKNQEVAHKLQNSLKIQYCFTINSKYFYSKDLKFGRFLFLHTLSYRFNPIRSQLETVLDFWLVYVCVKECELIKGGHIFLLLAVTTLPHRKLSSKFWPIFRHSFRV